MRLEERQKKIVVPVIRDWFCGASGTLREARCEDSNDSLTEERWESKCMTRRWTGERGDPWWGGEPLSAPSPSLGLAPRSPLLGSAAELSAGGGAVGVRAIGVVATASACLTQERCFCRTTELESGVSVALLEPI